jgi:hypothetical protein
LLAEVVKEGRRAKEPSESGLVELGIQIRQNLWAHWNEFKAIYAHLLGMEDVGEARLRKTWGGPVAALSKLCIVLSVNSVLAAGRKRRGGGMMP